MPRMLSPSTRYARRILPIVSTVIIPAGPLCNQRRHPPTPESVNYWTPIPSPAGQLFHADSHAVLIGAAPGAGSRVYAQFAIVLSAARWPFCGSAAALGTDRPFAA